MEWQKVASDAWAWRGYRITAEAHGEGWRYRAFSPEGAFLAVGGGEAAAFREICENHAKGR
ncbi:hypothetical protein DKK66_19990 (plasmid) [Aquitalea sp. USM4]|nr:hypothetical protein DKK66_19990 [Aquitalea sp. USM4]